MSASIASRANSTMESNSCAPSARREFSMRPSMCLSLSPAGASGGAPSQDVRGRAPQRVTAPRVQCLRHGQDVVGLVAVRRERHRFARELEIPQVNAHRQDVDLPAGVVDVVLAIEIVPGGLEQVAERRAIGAPTAVTHVHGAGGIGRDELDHDLAAATHLAATVGLAQRGDRPEFREPGILRQPEIDEAGAGDFRAGDQAVRRAGPGQWPAPVRAGSCARPWRDAWQCCRRSRRAGDRARARPPPGRGSGVSANTAGTSDRSASRSRRSSSDFTGEPVWNSMKRGESYQGTFPSPRRSPTVRERQPEASRRVTRSAGLILFTGDSR